MAVVNLGELNLKLVNLMTLPEKLSSPSQSVPKETEHIKMLRRQDWFLTSPKIACTMDVKTPKQTSMWIMFSFPRLDQLWMFKIPCFIMFHESKPRFQPVLAYGFKTDRGSRLAPEASHLEAGGTWEFCLTRLLGQEFWPNICHKMNHYILQILQWNKHVWFFFLWPKFISFHHHHVAAMARWPFIIF